MSSMQALVSVGMNINRSEAAGYELPETATDSPQFITRSSGGRGRNSGVVVPPALIELLLVRRWWRDYDLQSQRRLESLLADYDLEAGGQAHRVGGAAAAPVQEPSVKFLLPLPYVAFIL
jgi:hypothetical protein